MSVNWRWVNRVERAVGRPSLMRSALFVLLGGIGALSLAMGAVVPAIETVAATRHAGGPVDDRLLGHWPLEHGAADQSRFARSARVEALSFSTKRDRKAAARFDGRQSLIEVPHHESLRLGTGDFTVALDVHTAESLDDLLGDLVSKFDPATRRGLSLSIKNNAGVTLSQSNYRHVFFGIDSATEPAWIDRGRPGNAVYVCALAVHAGELYAGTCEPGRDEAGHVYRYVKEPAGGRWVDCGSPADCNAVMSLAVHDGQLFAGVGKYRLRGSALPESENTRLGGKVFRYENSQWIDCGQLPGAEAVGGLGVYRGRLYATSLYPPAGFFRYEGGNKWTDCGTPDGKRVQSLAPFNGHLYATSYDGGRVYRYDGESWTDLGQVGDNTQTYAFAVYRGHLYVSTWPSGRVYRLDSDTWFDVGQLGNEREVMGMLVHNGKLYAGTLPLAHVFRYDRDGWTDTGRLDLTPDVMYRRAWTMAEFRGQLFCGTLPGGRVQSLEPGRSVSHDHELSAGWHHIAAVRAGDRLKLYIDGKLVASSRPFDKQRFDLSNEQPLSIGFGPTDHFNGSLRDVRLYNCALGEDEIAALAK